MWLFIIISRLLKELKIKDKLKINILIENMSKFHAEKNIYYETLRNKITDIKTVNCVKIF